jgi:hypothetical protein
LWNQEAVEDAVHYVVAEQGAPMAIYDCRHGAVLPRSTADNGTAP